ncbi:uncharacterized protein LOC106363282 [Brassica napus]|uniref:uncharacterized protein LOC106363282 n=1 Tax=Brassica napus TaxID=3708 RepID=UPI002079CF5E|nr:uncharacterized protein LOC106363282 [Brassica napus]
MAGISEEEQGRILRNFPFDVEDLPVHYLGLPLMTQAMRRQDFLPLLERIRARISSWTSRFLSYAGRLQLIKAVLMSIINFWAAAFRLPSQCIKEIEQLCSAFLWTGPDLKSIGAKVSWHDICKKINEGGLGIKALKEVNKVQGLKLIWRLVAEDSVWSKWIRSNLLRKKSFWEVNVKSQAGSWIWKKNVKTSRSGKDFSHESCWEWSPHLLLETVVEAMQKKRRRTRHRGEILNEIEMELSHIKAKQSAEGEGMNDVDLWRWNSGYKPKFSTQETWKMTRISYNGPVAFWSQGIDTACVLCKRASETHNHLFFECSFSSQIWESLMKGILHSSYSGKWEELVRLLATQTMEKNKRFCFRYTLQATVYMLWSERNRRRHGEQPMPANVLTKHINKAIRRIGHYANKCQNQKPLVTLENENVETEPEKEGLLPIFDDYAHKPMAALCQCMMGQIKNKTAVIKQTKKDLLPFKGRTKLKI